MAGFSVGEAVGSGFRLIGREPKTILIWIGAYAVVALAMYGAMLSLLPDLIGYYQTMGRNLTEGSPPAADQEAMAMASKMLGLAPIFGLVGLVLFTVMQGAVFRALLHPEDRRFAYLRFGRGELWLLLSTLVLWILIGVIYIALAIVFGIVGGVVGAMLAGASGNEAAIVGPIMISIFLCLLISVWIGLRLSLALPMSHDQGRFVMLESWRATKGQSLKMLVVGIVLVAIVIVYEIVVMLVLGVVVVGASGLGGMDALLTAPADDLASRLTLWLPVFALVVAALSVPMYTVLIAPIADIYRQLTASAAPADAA